MTERQGWLTHWPVALGIGVASGVPALLMLLYSSSADWIVLPALLLMLAAPVFGIGYLALVLTERWLRRTVMTLIVGGLLARLLFEIGNGFANGWSGRGGLAMCNESAVPWLIGFFGAVLLLAAGLRRFARGPVK